MNPNPHSLPPGPTHRRHSPVFGTRLGAVRLPMLVLAFMLAPLAAGELATAANRAANPAAKKASATGASSIESTLAAGGPRSVVLEALRNAAESPDLTTHPQFQNLVASYISHRDRELRQAAILALGRSKDARTVPHFLQALRSSDPVLRGHAASALGALGTSAVVGDLDRALTRGVYEAATGIGQLCNPEQCVRYVDRLGSLPFDVMVSGVDAILFRTPALPEKFLLDAVGKIRELGTPEAVKYLRKVQKRWPASGSAKVKAALESALESALLDGNSNGAAQ
jgi:HEAT repeat protein